MSHHCLVSVPCLGSHATQATAVWKAWSLVDFPLNIGNHLVVKGTAVCFNAVCSE